MSSDVVRSRALYAVTAVVWAVSAACMAWSLSTAGETREWLMLALTLAVSFTTASLVRASQPISKVYRAGYEAGRAAQAAESSLFRADLRMVSGGTPSVGGDVHTGRGNVVNIRET
jgi:hypothetical protein